MHFVGVGSLAASRVPPRRAGNFLLLAQKKVTKEESLKHNTDLAVQYGQSAQRAPCDRSGIRLGVEPTPKTKTKTHTKGHAQRARIDPLVLATASRWFYVAPPTKGARRAEQPSGTAKSVLCSGPLLW